ncbi:DUF2189 domain-containing protein [Parachitinimonas caeni]|uniref:DUF2189 domain-containing protein n=1 Tax=Parachitinimonas caeni TaxID=3031301 RepID=A0ABT7DZN2_9NEIS|nr:DUF2189 domain-containing protein [Parachitinimonas caeni]MDK2124538.1 DUF2189 domain-containing protein [Parachitinimonas caeni]
MATVTDELPIIEPEAQVRPPKAIGQWMRQAFFDWRTHPLSSTFYGAAFAVMGWLLHDLFFSAPHHVITLATAFLLAGPFLSIGLYEISRRTEARGPVRLIPTLTAWRHNVGGISLFSIILALLVAGWLRVSVVIVALFLEADLTTTTALFSTSFLSVDNLPFIAIYLGTAIAFGGLVFAISVVSIPLMLDRDCDTLTAIFASVRVVVASPVTMLLWGSLICAMTVIGFLTHFVGLALVGPVVGHATWHAYRDLLR